MDTPCLEIDLGKLRHNARKIVELCSAYDVDATFITKGFCAKPEVIRAAMEGGVRHFGDSRIQNIRTVKRAIPGIEYLLIRVPKLSETADVVTWADCSLQSQMEVISAVSEEAVRQGKVHRIILMMDVGDLREGVFGEEELRAMAPQIKALPGVELIGVGTNVGCYGSILPSVENTAILVRYRDILNQEYGFHADVISGGATCTLKLMEEGRLPKGVNMLRIGEAILYGEDTNNARFLDGLYADAFVFHAEVVELKRKPSVPIGERGRDGFGNIPEYPDRGTRWRAVCAAGKQDVFYTALTPLLPGAQIIGASCDHLLVDVEDCIDRVKVGSLIPFRCGYAAALSATTSPYVTILWKDSEK